MADSIRNESTPTTPSPDQMYCHACHHQWQRQGETLQCPACNNATTEIITPENDPRHFHRRPLPATVEDAPAEDELQPDYSAAATVTESQQPTEVPTSNTETQNANESNGHNDARPQTEANGTSTTSGNTQTSDETNTRGTQEQTSNASNTEAPRSGSRSTNTQHFDIRFIFPPMTFFTTVISEPLTPRSQQQPAGSQPNGQAQSTEQSNEQPNNQQSNASNTSTNVPTPNGSTASGPSPITFFGLHFFTPRPPHAHTAPASNAASNTTQTEGTAQQQSQSNDEQAQASQQQQPQQGPQPATQGQSSPFGSGPVPAGLMNAILSAMFSPLSPLVLGNLNFVNDGVYSQEAFDRIITQLREQHAAQNPGGAPPASQAAIEKLRVKDIDEQMLQGCQDNKAKCVICVDEMTLGDKATLLPCNHFFHGECVTPWLKVHNTCPVCRRSVEVEEAPESKKRKNVAEHEPTGRDGHGIDEAEDEDEQQSAEVAAAIPERQRRPYGPERLRGEGTDCA
ncbi:uncharacterized protein NCU06815 [Neurospora crassa OR74A]|uniref:RING-type E3 ubiquitin transferase n=1 Tax=Neurospora crassa (strain ATCC 24698 / 74-OR23-1A / CBS 708.71 / DSM 1257 / FGSC 987) TaxID=367110 RepID=V5IPX7_NEUCR|nr:uncharacterized protein NCU06815 [Neurospora crassa OR74A]ESA43574.1 hypothetical protein, variant [Neurospora crassa OR74A]|eukprot:XP_011393595.1 uncharacterized protein NCU06815 [Neurospora crassa OR74A]